MPCRLAYGSVNPRPFWAQPWLLGLTADRLAQSGAACALTGTVDEMCATLLRRRETLGISYILTADELMEALAPVVERLAGR